MFHTMFHREHRGSSKKYMHVALLVRGMLSGENPLLYFVDRSADGLANGLVPRSEDRMIVPAHKLHSLTEVVDELTMRAGEGDDWLSWEGCREVPSSCPDEVEEEKNDSKSLLQGSLLNMGLVRMVCSSRRMVGGLNTPVSDRARLVLFGTGLVPRHWRAALPKERFERRDYEDVGDTFRGSGPRNCNRGWLQRGVRTAGWNEGWERR